jgi:divalent metal cation (Fe/Co/Zn/Cd) transporter
LASSERPDIRTVLVFDHVIWAGWPMLAALAYSSIPTLYLGRLKLRLAPRFHDKILYADAKMMSADWKSGAAAAIGVIGAGMGFWWADSIAAALVSLDILKDGLQNLGVAVADLSDRRPRKTDGSDWEELPDHVRQLLLDRDWVQDAHVRMREEGHIFLGEAFVVPRPGTTDLIARIERVADDAHALDWRVHELVVMPVAELPDQGLRPDP